MSIKFTKILSLLGQATAGTIIGVFVNYLISKQDKHAHLSKNQLLSEINRLFDNLSKLISESPIKNLLTEIKYILPNKITKSYKNNHGFEDEYLEGFEFGKKRVYSKELSLDVNFKTSVKDNSNIASYDIVCEYNDKKYKFSMLFNKMNKENYETIILGMMEHVEPSIKQLDEMIFVYSYDS